MVEEENKNIENQEIKKEKFRIITKLPWRLIIRWSLFVISLVCLVMLFPKGSTTEYSNLKLDFISTREIIAPFDFEMLKSEEELKNEREAARMAVMPVFIRSEEIASRNLTRLDSLTKSLERLLFDKQWENASDSVKSNKLDEINWAFGINLTTEIFKIPRSQLTRAMWNELVEILKVNLNRVFNSGIINSETEATNTTANADIIISKGVEQRISYYSTYSLTRAKSTILDELKKTFREGDKRINLGYEIILNFIEPNLIYDREVTEKRRSEASSKIATAKGIVLKGERIIDSNERVTPEHLEKIQSLVTKKQELAAEEVGFARLIPLLGKILFSGGILLLFGFLIFHYHQKLIANKNFLLILLILFSHLAFLRLILAPAGLSTILFPAALATMLTTIFFGPQIGFWFLGMLALFAGVMHGNDFQLTMMSLTVGSVGIFSVKSLKSRTQILSSAFYLAVAYIVFLSGYYFIQHAISSDLLLQIGLAILNSVMTPIFVLGFAIILGNLFDITTDLTLLELSDLNRPLLKQLAATAPGTYHHSIMVGTLAEAAAEAVEADPLLARTAAYYHDIGKINNRDYFIENQLVFNPHDTLKPEESVKILGSHVEDGLAIAEKHRLPKVIKDAIISHHGTTTMKYFFHKALKNNKGIKEKDFQYTGPLPISKETGIIMLADVVEAAVRSMGDVSSAEIREKVKEMIDTKIDEGQLLNCELSIKDLKTIEDSFTKTLKAQAHHRVPYPSQEQIQQEMPVDTKN